MKRYLTLLAAAAMLAAACAPKAGKTTQVVGQFSENAPETVRIVLGESVDTTVTVTDSRFQVAIPTDLTDFAYLETDFTPVSFISDGSKITVDPVAGTAVSSNKKGAQAHYAAYNDWMEKFMADYRAKIAEFGEDEEAAEKYFNGIIDEFNDYQKETAKANLDNIVGLMAISQIMDDDQDELLALLNGLSDEMKATPQAARMLASFETLAKTGEGQPFVDFTVVQEPAVPEASTVKSRRSRKPRPSSSPTMSGTASSSWSISGHPGAARAARRCRISRMCTRPMPVRTSTCSASLWRTSCRRRGKRPRSLASPGTRS